MSSTKWYTRISGMGGTTHDSYSSQADAQGRATFVLTGDAWKYYESVGYKLIGEDWFGNDNPKWHGPPGPIRLVSIS